MLAVGLRLGGGEGWRRLGADLGVRTQPPHGPIGQLSQSALDWLAKLPLLGGLKNVNLQLFAGLLVATVAVVAGVIVLGWLWSTWDRHAIAGFFQRHRTGSASPGGLAAVLRRAPTVAFFVVSGLLLSGTAAVAQRYGGAWWLWLAFLTAGVFTAALTVARWLTCLRGPARQERASSSTEPSAQPGEAAVR